MGNGDDFLCPLPGGSSLQVHHTVLHHQVINRSAGGRREVVQYSLDQALPGIMELYEELALEDKAKPVAR